MPKANHLYTRFLDSYEPKHGYAFEALDSRAPQSLVIENILQLHASFCTGARVTRSHQKLLEYSTLQEDDPVLAQRALFRFLSARCEGHREEKEFREAILQQKAFGSQ